MLAAIPLLLFVAGGLSPAADPSTHAGAATPKPIKRSLASTTWPVEPSFNAGFVVSRDSFAPFVGASVFVPILPGVGPAAVVRVSGVQSGTLGVVESVVAVGPALETQLGGLRARLTVAAGALVHSYGYDASDNGNSVGGAVLVPVEVGLPLGNGVSFDLSITGGLSRGVIHAVDDVVAYSRDRAFVYVGAGLNFGGPPD